MKRFYIIASLLVGALAFSACEEKLAEPVFPMDIYMKKPWEITNCEEEDNSWQEE